MTSPGLAAAEELKRLRPRLLRACRAYLGERHEEAADLVQDAFSALPPATATAGSLEPWLMQTCLQLCKARLRCREGIVRGLEAELLLAAGSPPTEPAGSENLQLRKQRDLRLLGEAIQALSMEDRQILQLRHVKGLTYAQIGATLELAWGQVAGRLLAAREELRAAQRFEPRPAVRQNAVMGPWAALTH